MPAWDMRDKSLDYALARKLIAQWREVGPDDVRDYSTR